MRVPLKEKAYNYILEEILDGKVNSNSSIVENDICDKLGISRTPVREAFKQLESEGLIVKYTDRGVFVKDISLTDIEEICQLRKMFEVEALKYSINIITVGEIDECRRLLYGLDDNPNSWFFFKADKSFHKLVMKYCPNHRLLEYYKNLEIQIERFQRLLAKEKDHYRVVQAQHLKLLDILESRNYDRAAIALSYHIDDIKQSLIDLYNKQRAEN